MKNNVSKFAQEHLPNSDLNFKLRSGNLWHRVFRRILNSFNGTSIRFHGKRMKLYVGSFGYKKKARYGDKLTVDNRRTSSGTQR